MLKKYSTSLNLADGVHASHNDYTTKIRAYLDNQYTKHKTKLLETLDEGDALEEAVATKLHSDITLLSAKLKDLIIEKSINGGVKVNALITDPKFIDLLK